jgi:DNA topoisomerase-2
MSEFKILTDAEHIRKRVQMYAGSATVEEITGMFFGQKQTLSIVPALCKIIREIIDNSIDEAVRTKYKFANKISVSIKKVDLGLLGEPYQVIVEDNGRGIPVTIVDGTNQYRPVLAWTQARAGSNFDDSRETIGANGVGSFLTNVFSTEFIGETSDGKTYLRLLCNGNANIKNIHTKESTQKFTRVSFIPDVAAFGLSELTQDHIDFFKDQFENLAVCFPEIKFTFNDEPIRVKKISEYAAKFNPVNVIAENSAGVIILAPSGATEEFQLHSYCNGLWLKNGGTHINYIVDRVIEPLRQHIKKKHKIDVLPNSIRQHLTVVTVLRNFVNMKFDSQTKERLTNTVAELSSHLSGFDFDKIAKSVLNTPEIIDPMIQSILHKKELEERRELEKKKKTLSRTPIINHIAATNKDRSQTVLCITEGQSALGSLLTVRDPKIHGGYPLKGKVMNVRGMKPIEILKNKEISELLSIIGLEFGKPATNLNYGRIAIFTDMDTDGNNIFCLLLNLFSHWKELFDGGRVVRLLAPLYYCKKGKQVKTFDTIDEFQKFDSTGWNVSYFKGLGSMPKDIYSEVINNPRYVTVTPEGIERLEMAFGDSADARKEWMLNTDFVQPVVTDKKTITSAIDTEYLDYSMYTIENRAIPSVIDGLKPVQRILVHAMLNSPKGFQKLSELGGSVAKYGYHHGEVSAIAAINGMTAEWSNNAPIFEGQGNFGSRLIQEPAAPRYIYAKLSDNFKKFFIDEEVVDYSDDPEQCAPLHYLPVIPWVLVNGVSGIAVGFASNILPRSTHSLVAAVKECIKNPTKFLDTNADILPSFPSFNGEVVSIGDNQYKSLGKIEYIGKYQYKISELPVGYDRATYVTFLNTLIDSDKIRDYEDHCSDAGFVFTVKVTGAQKDSIDKDPLSYFKLAKIHSENLTTLDQHGKLKIFKSVASLIHHFVEYRLSKFQQKLDYEKKTYDNQVEYLTAKKLFIEHVIDNKIDFRKMSKNDLLDYIRSNITENEFGTRFSNIAIYECTTDKVSDLISEIADIRAKLDTLSTETSTSRFISVLPRK